jgi:hypothetical protein
MLTGFYLHLRPEPGHAAPPEVRMRRLLKAALRSFGLRCVSVAACPVEYRKATREGRGKRKRGACLAQESIRACARVLPSAGEFKGCEGVNNG